MFARNRVLNPIVANDVADAESILNDRTKAEKPEAGVPAVAGREHRMIQLFIGCRGEEVRSRNAVLLGDLHQRK